MKSILLIYLIVFPALYFAQKSYDFSDALPPKASEVKTVNSIYFGRYSSENSDREFEFSEKGLLVHQLQIQSISRETLRESTKYRLSGNYLHGVLKKDSVQVVEDGNLLFFAIPITEQMAGGKSKNQLKQVSANSYMLNFYENGHFVPCLISLVQQEMRLQYFDYADSTIVFDTFEVVKSKKDKGLVTNTLRPTLAQFSSTDLKQIFGHEVIYKKMF
jgi:hypothetical protein